MELDCDTTRTTLSVFDEYANPEEDGFVRTHVLVKMAAFEGETLVSRSQAKRLQARFEQFKEVLLDFDGVEFIGPAFVDEVFRVFRNEHPEVLVRWTNADPKVRRMIRGAFDGDSEMQGRLAI